MMLTVYVVTISMNDECIKKTLSTCSEVLEADPDAKSEEYIIILVINDKEVTMYCKFGDLVIARCVEKSGDISTMGVGIRVEMSRENCT